MTVQVTLDEAGRVSIPKDLRDELHLEPGDSLELEAQGHEITLRPVRAATPTCAEDRFPVYGSGVTTDVSIRSLIEEGREERFRELMGRFGESLR